MSTSEYSIKMTLGYTDTDFTRTMTAKGVDSASAAANTVRTKAQAVNASLEGGTDGGLNSFFLSDDYDQSEGIGTLKEISQVIINQDDVTVLI